MRLPPAGELKSCCRCVLGARRAILKSGLDVLAVRAFERPLEVRTAGAFKGTARRALRVQGRRMDVGVLKGILGRSRRAIRTRLVKIGLPRLCFGRRSAGWEHGPRSRLSEDERGCQQRAYGDECDALHGSISRTSSLRSAHRGRAYRTDSTGGPSIPRAGEEKQSEGSRRATRSSSEHGCAGLQGRSFSSKASRWTPSKVGKPPAHLGAVDADQPTDGTKELLTEIPAGTFRKRLAFIAQSVAVISGRWAAKSLFRHICGTKRQLSESRGFARASHLRAVL
jgi:hypothetical protein